jgi:hypothetical protein
MAENLRRTKKNAVGLKGKISTTDRQNNAYKKALM